MLIVCMSAAGTVPLIICTVLWLFGRKSFSFRLGKKLLFVSMGFYLLPLQLVKFLLPQDVVRHIDLGSDKNFFAGFQKWEPVAYQEDLFWIPDWLLFLIVCWFLAVVLFSVYQTVNYLHKIKRLGEKSSEKTVEVPGRGGISIRVSKAITSPYTVGFFRPFIVFPEFLLDNDVFIMLYGHEYTHLKNRDSLAKLICLGIVCLHWFNPAAILLLVYYVIFSEFVADEEAVKDFSDKDKKKYMRLLIELSSERKVLPVIWRNGFLCGKNILKRRMENIMRKRKMSKVKKVLAACAVVFSIVLGSSSVIAYSPLQTSDEEAGKDMFANAGEFVEFANEEKYDIDFSESDMVFVSRDNKCTPIFNTEINPYALCIHEFEEGYFYKHVSNSSGGCTMYVYQGRKCVKCNYIDVDGLVNTITFAKCIHGY